MVRKGWRSSIAVLALALAVTRVDAQVGEGRIAVDAAAPTRPFPHFWVRMFGSGRALLTLRESYRQDLRAVRGVTAVAYIRFHGILHDELGVYTEAPQGEPVYNFSYVEDRKSTRLNSSHLGISYAVFCLKKKKPNVYVSFLP